jgi:hypothetical protein
MKKNSLSIWVDRVALALPAGASLVPAMMTFQNVQKRLGYDGLTAFVAAAFVEGMGFVTITTALDIYELIQAETDPQKKQWVQFWVAIGGTMFYLIVVILLNALLDDGGTMKKISLGMLSSLSIVGGLMIALRKNMAKRLDEIVLQDQEQRNQEAHDKQMAQFERERVDRLAAEERQAKREMRLAEKRIELELRVAENNKQGLPVTTGLTEGTVGGVASGTKSLRWSLLGDSDKRRVIAIMRECQGTNGEQWKKPAAVTVRVAFGLDERQSYKWLEYAERDVDKFAEVIA